MSYNLQLEYILFTKLKLLYQISYLPDLVFLPPEMSCQLLNLFFGLQNIVEHPKKINTGNNLHKFWHKN